MNTARFFRIKAGTVNNWQISAVRRLISGGDFAEILK
jgi:hypothetical protein